MRWDFVLGVTVGALATWYTWRSASIPGVIPEPFQERSGNESGSRP